MTDADRPIPLDALRASPTHLDGVMRGALSAIRTRAAQPTVRAALRRDAASWWRPVLAAAVLTAALATGLERRRAAADDVWLLGPAVGVPSAVVGWALDRGKTPMGDVLAVLADLGESAP